MCQTINLGSRRYCKGCTGKLPAYYSANASLASQQSTRQRVAPPQPRRVSLASGCMGALLIVVAAATGLPLVESAQSEAPVERTLLQPLAPIALPARAAMPVAVPPESTTLAISEAPPETGFSAADEDEYETLEKAAVDRPSRRVAAVKRQAPPPQHVPAVQSAAVQLAKCDELNFFARAMCVNRTCAEPSAARASSCAQPIRQRRLDEARRDPTLAG
ncbi:hypothetical protein [Variovorax rhizosphaerae]|uniref:Uncharacterized protein n=1 Tax=Variovorax rhizosphaerae TaxID=1836200 RepID=A0ABU8WWT4_9BURK